ncbi:MAG TPA: histidinol-phosphate transaminase [Opitutaceae bacterium]|jgi:histidinol-phosphate aminotransferase|nr:histidinol-phosphate transaminase [Opitutaceae bacterium]
MKASALANPTVLTQPVYEPGKPIEDVARELGLEPKAILKLASNENPFGPSPRAVAAAKAALEQGQLYPDGACFALRHKLALRHGLAPEQFAVGNGSNELLELLGHVFLLPGDEVVMADPSFIVYRLVTLLFGARAVAVPLADHTHDLAEMARAVTARTKLVYVGSPNNPTGTANSPEEIAAFAQGLPEHVVLALDEAYAEYQERPADLRPLIAAGRKIVCLRTFSKVFGLASLRVGYGYGPLEVITLLNRVRQPFNVNAIAQAAALAALDDREFVAGCVRANREGLRQLEAGCDRLGLKWVPSQANFLLVHVGEGTRWFDALQRRGVIVRPLMPYSLPEWIRITVGTPEQNDRVLAELARLK